MFGVKKTDRPGAAASPTRRSALNAPGLRRIRDQLRQARLILTVERGLAAAWPALGVVSGYLAASLLGVWEVAPRAAHIAVLAAAAVVSAVLFLRAWRALPPLRPQAAEERLERDSRLPHQPLQALQDAPATDLSETGAAFWRAHRAQSGRALRRTRLSPPDPRLRRRDPMALRMAATFAVICAAALAWSDVGQRLRQAVSPSLAARAGSLDLDVWITPPDYTGLAPIFLAGPNARGGPRPAPPEAPSGSTISVRLDSAARNGALILQPGQGPRTKLPLVRQTEGGLSIDASLEESASVALKAGGVSRKWRIDVVNDDAPVIRFLEDPQATDDGRLKLSFAARDDYGVDAARAEIRLVEAQPFPLTGAPEPAIFEQRRITPLAFSAQGSAEHRRETTLDLRQDPWAGLTAEIVLIAEDAKGQTARSQPRRAVLPEREFFAPLAKAIIEQRRKLALAPRQWPRAAQAFEALTLAPELFFDNARDYLLLRSAYWRLVYSEGEALEPLTERLWDLALRFEDGDLSLARRELEAAVEELRQALERGASAEEIAEKSAAVRTAMERYMAALAANAAANGDFAEAGGEDAWSTDDLREMLEAVESL
ncbi:MAG: DUF4175 family protein, partial [Pseudomonadota bacterium]